MLDKIKENPIKNNMKNFILEYHFAKWEEKIARNKVNEREKDPEFVLRRLRVLATESGRI